MKLVMSSLLVAFASSALVAATPAQADPAPAKVAVASSEKLALARQLLAKTDPAEDVVELFRMGFWRGVSDSITDEAVLKEAKAGLDLYLARLEPKLRENMPPVIEAFAQVYAREYSVEELQQLNAFAATPAGNHYLRNIGRLENDESIVRAQTEMMEKLSPTLEDLQKDMCAAKAAKRVAMGNKKAKCPLSQPDTQAG